MGTSGAKRDRTWGTGGIEGRGPKDAKGNYKKWVLRLSHRTDPTTGRRIRENVTFKGSRREAEAELARLAKQGVQGVALAGAGVSLDVWLRQQVTTGLSLKTGERRSAYTQAGMLALWDRFSTPQLRGTPLRHLTATTLKGHVGELQQRTNAYTGDRIAPRTVAIYFNVIRAVLFAAVEDGVIPLNPAAGIKVRGGSVSRNTQPDPLNVEDTKRFLAHDPTHRLHALWHVGAHTGCRPGEALALRWSDWDKEAGTLRFAQSLEIGSKHFRECKAGSARTVAVNPALKTVLLAHQLKQNGERAKLDKDCAPGESRWVDGSLMFSTEIGSALDHHNVRRLHRARLKAAALRRVTWYSLRHGLVTTLAGLGTDPKEVAGVVGHRNIRTTLQYYDKPSGDRLRVAVGKLPWATAAS